MDPAKTSAMYGPPGMIYETLIARDKTGAYVPGLADSWVLTNRRGTDYPYNATLELTLKAGVKFHDNSTFDANAIKRIINYYAQDDSWVQYEFWCVFGCQNKTGWPDQGMWAKDATHLTLNLTWADVALVFNLSHLYGSMMGPDALEADGYDDYGTAGHKVVGTGPFMLQEWVAHDHITLVKNPNYTWGASWYTNKGPAKIDKIIYRVMTDPASRFAAFESGAVDILQQVPPSKIETYLETDGVTVMTGPGQGTYHVEFNCQKDPWTSVPLRQAFAYSINRTQILETVWKGYGEIGTNYLSPIEPESTKIPASANFTYDPDLAEQYFADAGWTNTDTDVWLENSTGDELTLPLSTTDKGEDVLMGELIQNQFQAMGVHVELTQMQEAALRDSAAAGEQDAMLFWYSWPRAEILDWHFGTWAAGGGSNTGQYMDDIFDGYVTNWTYAETEDQFSDNATNGHLRLLSQAPWAPIIFWHQIFAIHDYVTGWYVHPLGQEQVIDIVDVDIET
jgi:peptide/nickel transport system substrate-binding protein